MTRKKVMLTPAAEKILEKAGIRIKKARLRRNIKAEVLAEKAGISKGTLGAIEKGVSTVSIGAYVAVLAVFGMEKDLENIARDEEGKQQYRELKIRKRVRTIRRKQNGSMDDSCRMYID